ncbi:MAG: lipoyl synthase [Bdellovibrio sp.]|nr:MAG: lipoyl synthase [Bdellovibrio sp.]
MKTTTLPPKPKIRPPSGPRYLKIKELLSHLSLATVCQEARCPNMGECWGGGTATIMIMGDVCTRGCRFCSVKTGNPKGVLDQQEPYKVAHAVSVMGLDYVVLTSVDRDDLEDQGAGHFAKTVKEIKKLSSKILVEVLTPDFKGETVLIDKVIEAAPDVFAHNVETVEALQKEVRDPRAGYEQSLFVLEYVKKQNPQIYTKTSLMLGLGETNDQIFQCLKDLRQVGCDILTFGQYLQPAKHKLKVKKYLSSEEFSFWKAAAEELGFLYVASGPLVRSSYRAGELFVKGLKKGEHISWD